MWPFKSNQSDSNNTFWLLMRRHQKVLDSNRILWDALADIARTTTDADSKGKAIDALFAAHDASSVFKP